MNIEQRQAREQKENRRRSAMVRQGVVTAVSPLEVAIGGSDVSVLAVALDGVELSVNDRVTVLTWGTDLLVLGRNTADPQDAGGGGGPTYTEGTAIDISGGTISVDLGSSGSQAAVGNDSRFPTADQKAALSGTDGTPGSGNKYVTNSDSRNSDQRVPINGSVDASKVASSLKPSGTALGTDESLRRLGTGSTHAAAGDDSRFPTSGQKNALAGTAGTPGTGNEYATKQTTDLLAPKASPTFTGNVVVPDADASNEAVNLGQQQQAILEANAGYTRLADVDKAPIAFNTSGLAGDWSGAATWATFGTRSGNVITGASNGLLHSRDYVWGGLETPDPSDAVSLGDEFVLTQEGVVLGDAASNGIWVVTRTGGPSATFELTRRADADTTGELVQFNIVQAQSNGAQYKLVTADPITINTTDQDWQPYKFYPSEHAASHAPGGSDSLGVGLGIPVYQTLLQGAIGATGFASITTTAGIFQTNGAPAGAAPILIYIDPADFAISGMTTKLRVRAQFGTNATSPAITATVGLYPVSSHAGGAGALTSTLGTVVSGSTVAKALTGSNRLEGNSGDFNVPSAGWYGIGVVGSGTQATNSYISISAQLQIRHV